MGRMSWQLDGRHGAVMQGASRREGFALMRDQARQLIAFQTVPKDGDGTGDEEPARGEYFVIGEGDFEPTAA